MKGFLALVLSLLLGVAAGTGLALVNDSDPGAQYEKLVRAGSELRTPVVAEPASDQEQFGTLVVADGETFEFGVMDRGERRRHTFTIHNHTAQPVKLRVGSTTCKCTVGELEEDTIQANAAGEVTLEWVARSYEPRFEQSATIETTDPVRPKIILSVSGQVLQLVQPIPQAVTLGDVPYGSERTKVFRIYSFQDADLSLVGYEFDQPETAEFFALDWQPIDLTEAGAPPGATAAVECTLRVAAGLPYGQVTQSIRITTDAEQSAVVELPLMGRVISDLVIAGTGYIEEAGILKLGVVPQGQGLERTLRVVARRADVHDVQVTVSRVEPADVLEVEVGTPQPLKGGSVLMFPLTVRVRPDAKPVNFNGDKNRPRSRIVLDTTHPVMKQIELDVRFSVL